MLARVAAATLVIVAATSVAEAQRRAQAPRIRSFPAEKFSTQPVQGTPAAKVNPTGSEKAQKQRWDERSRIPSAAPK
jgi:hypothetical protein